MRGRGQHARGSRGRGATGGSRGRGAWSSRGAPAGSSNGTSSSRGRGCGRGGGRGGGRGDHSGRVPHHQLGKGKTIKHTQPRTATAAPSSSSSPNAPSSLFSSLPPPTASSLFLSSAPPAPYPSSSSSLINPAAAFSQLLASFGSSSSGRHAHLLNKRKREQEGQDDIEEEEQHDQAEEEQEEQEHEEKDQEEEAEGEEDDDDDEEEEEEEQQEEEGGEERDDDAMEHEEERQAVSNEDDEDDDEAADKEQLEEDEDGEANGSIHGEGEHELHEEDEEDEQDEGDVDEYEPSEAAAGGSSGAGASSAAHADDDEEGEDTDPLTRLSSAGSTAVELTHADPFISHFSHHHTLQPATLHTLSQPATLTKLPSLPYIKEHLFISNWHIEHPTNATNTTISSASSSPAELASDDAISTERLLGLCMHRSMHLTDYHVRPKLIDQWRAHIATKQKAKIAKDQLKLANKQQTQQSQAPSPAAAVLLDDDVPHHLHRLLLPVLTSYHDLMFPSLTPSNHTAIIQLYALHALNHIVKTKDVVARHTAKLTEWHRKHTDKQAEAGSSSSKRAKKHKKAIKPTVDRAVPPEYRDEGFTKPKVLILLPFANTAYTLLTTLIRLYNPSQILNHARFTAAFAPSLPDDAVDPSKPADYRHTFAGKTDDAFRIGVAFGKRSMKLYASFHAADLIVASPLGLRMIVGSEGDKQRQLDFLSSIEVLIVDQAHVLAMQNLDHLLTLLPAINTLPRSLNQTDFSRVKHWYVHHHARYYRQTLVFSAYTTAELQHVFTHSLVNVRGAVTLRPQYTGVLPSVIHPVRQLFERVHVTALAALSDERFDHFFHTVFPKLKASYAPTPAGTATSASASAGQGHVLLYIPHYFDYVRVRNQLRARHVSFACCSEYTSNAELSRSRSAFYHGTRSFLLVTERFQFFKRYTLRGIRHVVFYSPPVNATFYAEIINWIEASHAGHTAHAAAAGAEAGDVSVSGASNLVLCLYTRYEHRELERIVGSTRALKMLTDRQSTHMFT